MKLFESKPTDSAAELLLCEIGNKIHQWYFVDRPIAESDKEHEHSNKKKVTAFPEETEWN